MTQTADNGGTVRFCAIVTDRSQPKRSILHRYELETYFDSTAVEAWKRLTSDAPVSGIRATVHAGRDAMRDTLLGWLP